MAEVLGRLGTERAWVVQGTTGSTRSRRPGRRYVAELRDGQACAASRSTPEAAGLPRASARDLKGGDPARERRGAPAPSWTGRAAPIRDIVLLNAAAALIVAGKASDLRDGAALAAAAIDSGAARASARRSSSASPTRQAA